MPDPTNTLLFIIALLLAMFLLGVILLRFRLQERRESEQPSPPSSSDEAQDRQYSNSAIRVLTPREREIALLAARGLTNRQIAAELGLSINTMSNYLKRIYAKLEISSRTELAWRLQYMDMHSGEESSVNN
jgi:DNA-binding NarL/FixJ family response regulator